MVENVNAAYWDTEKGEVVLVDSVDISIAVATEKVLCSPSSSSSQCYLQLLIFNN